ncbi:MAG: hypothetical protein H6820_06940 [Phycisphaerales bacterium]|nr:hypothetical protein [Phycisphaerales bacterium]
MLSIHVAANGQHEYAREVTLDIGDSYSSRLGEFGFQLPKYRTAGYEDKVLARNFELPIWPLLLIMSWLVWRARQRLRQAKQRVNSCIQCGYSLAFNTTGTCPECGAAIQSVTTAIGET